MKAKYQAILWGIHAMLCFLTMLWFFTKPFGAFYAHEPLHFIIGSSIGIGVIFYFIAYFAYRQWFGKEE